MEIYIVRHADALQNDNIKDEERELSQKGKKQSKIIGKTLKILKIKPDKIITSKLERAIQTSKIIADEIKFKNIEENEILNPNSDINKVIDYITQCKQKNLNKILFVGHMPSLKYIIEKLISDGEINVNIKKASLCKINFEETGNLEYIINQDIMKKIIKK